MLLNIMESNSVTLYVTEETEIPLYTTNINV